MIHGIKYISQDIGYINGKHNCPICDTPLSVVKVSKVINSSSEEAKELSQSLPRVYIGGRRKFRNTKPVGNIKWIWKEFECPNCHQRLTVEQMKQIDESPEETRKDVVASFDKPIEQTDVEISAVSPQKDTQNRQKRTFWIAILIISIVSVVVNFLNEFPLQKRTTYELSPDMCSAFFWCEPEEFMNEYFDWYDNCEDFRLRAKINKNGNLVLRLTEEQEEAFLDAYDSDLEEFDEVQGVEISDDLTQITISGNKEEIANIIANEFPLYAFFDMMNRQLFSGKDPETISVTIKVVEKKYNNVVYTATWPDEDIELGVKRWKFIEDNATDIN